MKPNLSLILSLGCCTLAQAIALDSASAQITPDGTTDTNVSADGNDFTIQQGDQAGSNLFHSFRDFNVPNGGSAFFDNADDIVNIFSRVTGGNISNIDGLIKTNDASLFLINPAGIIFGAGARLDLGGGSFYGSSADSILFEDGEFSATDLDNPPLLTVNAPIGLSFRDNPGEIEVQQSELDGVTNLALIGGEININGAKLNAANINLGALAESGTVDLTQDNSFSFPDTVAKADISLTNGSFLGIFGTTGGSISVNANNLTHTEGSNAIVGTENEINIQTDNNIFFDNSLIITQVSNDLEGNSGNVNIVAKGNITFDNDSLIITQVTPDAVGNAGQIDVKADSLNLSGTSIWITNTEGQGNAGQINIDISNQITIDEGSLILSQVKAGGRGDAGDINITTGSLISTNGLIIADSSDLGSGGDINITARDTIVLQGVPIGNEEIPELTKDRPSQIITGLNENINEETNVVESRGQGNAGSINISAPQLIMKDRAFVISNIEKTTVGGGGEINFDVGIMRLENNSFVSTYTESEFNAGSINVNSQNLELVSGGKLITSTDGLGNAGTINLNITDNINIDNAISPTVPRVNFDDAVLTELQGRSGLFANATDRAIGNGGNIFIRANSGLPTEDITIANGGEIRADGGLGGNAGNISIAGDSLSLDSNALIVAETVADGGGNINLQISDAITLKNNSFISAEAFNDANGGNITIDTDFIIAFPSGSNGSDIFASAERGQGGNVNITAESIFNLEERETIQGNNTNDIDASSDFGLTGTVSITTPDVNPIQGATELPSDVVEPEQTTAQACAANHDNVAQNRLTINGKGGIPPAPTEPLVAEPILLNGQYSTLPNNQTQHSEIKPIKTSIGDIYPARGVTVTETGEVILTAYPTDNIDSRNPDGAINCDKV